MPFYLVPPASASFPAFAQATTAVPGRCCPGGINRSTRGRVYPSDMSDGEWAPRHGHVSRQLAAGCIVMTLVPVKISSLIIKMNPMI